MAPLKSALRRITPESFWEPISGFYWHSFDTRRNRIAALLSDHYRNSQAHIESLHDAHQGERCFIIGNGPSLRWMDLSLLKDEVTFGQNRIFLLFPKLGFEPTYFVSVNSLLIEQTAAEIERLKMPRFVSWRSRRTFDRDEKLLYINSEFAGPPRFSPIICGPIYEGSTVTYVTMQLAFHMGFKEVVLIGVDHRYFTPGKPNTTVVSNGIDQDHFATDYFPRGFRWQLPDLEASEAAYELAGIEFERHNRSILDATLGGNLKVFPKVVFEDLFRTISRP